MSSHRERVSKDFRRAIEQASKPKVSSCDQVVTALLNPLYPFKDQNKFDKLWIYPDKFVETFFKRLAPHWTTYLNRK
ncbi:MAG: hypothetical protein ACFFBD_13340, partial [Candidatus Hodarchaeota archaeon]